MSARQLVQAKELRDDGCIVEIVVWQLPHPLPPCRHRFKYRLYNGTARETRVRYDNERGKGDHRHVGAAEELYVFTTVDELFDDFRRDIEDWR